MGAHRDEVLLTGDQFSLRRNFQTRPLRLAHNHWISSRGYDGNFIEGGVSNTLPAKFQVLPLDDSAFPRKEQLRHVIVGFDIANLRLTSLRCRRISSRGLCRTGRKCHYIWIFRRRRRQRRSGRILLWLLLGDQSSVAELLCFRAVQPENKNSCESYQHTGRYGRQCPAPTQQRWFAAP